MIENPLFDLLTLSTTFYDVSVLCNRFSKAQTAQILAGGNAGVNTEVAKKENINQSSLKTLNLFPITKPKTKKTKIHFDCKTSIDFHWKTRRFPMRQIGTFWPLRRDCTRLRHRRMSIIVSKGRASFFLS